MCTSATKEGAGTSIGPGKAWCWKEGTRGDADALHHHTKIEEPWELIRRLMFGINGGACGQAIRGASGECGRLMDMESLRPVYMNITLFCRRGRRAGGLPLEAVVSWRLLAVKWVCVELCKWVTSWSKSLRRRQCGASL